MFGLVNEVVCNNNTRLTFVLKSHTPHTLAEEVIPSAVIGCLYLWLTTAYKIYRSPPVTQPCSWLQGWINPWIYTSDTYQ